MDGYTEEFGYYEYIATVWNDCEEKEEVAKGIVAGKTYVQAMKRIWEYYGDELNDVKIAALEADPVYEFGKYQGVLFDTTEIPLREHKE